MHARMYYACATLVQNAVVLYVESVKKGLCDVTGEKIDLRERMATPTRSTFSHTQFYKI